MIIDVSPEGWRDIPGYEGLYRASTYGNIYSCNTGKNITPWINNRGYCCVKLYKEGKREEFKVHQLIMLTFDPGGRTKIKNEVHHKDDNKLNNRFDNLMWCSRKKNMKYMHISRKDKKRNEAQEQKIVEQIKGPF